MANEPRAICKECEQPISYASFKFAFNVKEYLKEGRCQACQDKETDKWEDHAANQAALYNEENERGL